MKVIFFGLGSIGKRHANILLKKKNIDLYAYRTNQGSYSNDLGIKEVRAWNDIKKIQPDIAFITNPTFLHVDTALKCIDFGMKIFLEKPIGSSLKGLDLLIKKVKKRKVVSYVAYNLRFHPIIEYLKTYLKNKDIYHVNIYNSSNLIKWRPNKKYTEFYSVSSKKGGGVILDLSHEFDYIDYLFGPIGKIKGTFGKVSQLKGDCEDFVDVIIKTDKTYTNLHMNFFSLQLKRTIEIDFKQGFLSADLIKNRIKLVTTKGIKRKRFYSGINSSYRKQIKYFFNNLNNYKMMNNICDSSILFKKIIKFKNN